MCKCTGCPVISRDELVTESGISRPKPKPTLGPQRPAQTGIQCNNLSLNSNNDVVRSCEDRPRNDHFVDCLCESCKSRREREVLNRIGTRTAASADFIGEFALIKNPEGYYNAIVIGVVKDRGNLDGQFIVVRMPK